MSRALRAVPLFVSALAVMLLVAAGLSLVPVPGLAPAPASAATAAQGPGGQFVAVTGTLFDTRGTDVVPAAGVWTTLDLVKRGNIPAGTASAVQVSITALTPTAAGTVHVAADGATASWPALSYNVVSGESETMSNTAIVPVADDGDIRIQATTQVGLLVQLQGYYTAGAPSSSGYVPVAPKRILATNGGIGSPQAALASGQTITLAVGGSSVGAGVPEGATAAYINFTPSNTSTTSSGWFAAYAADGTPGASMSFPAAASASLGQVVPLSSDGKIKVDAHGTFNLMVDVLGYFAPNSSNGFDVTGGDQGAFTPAGETIATGISVAAKGTTTVQIAGAHGVPVAGSGITAAAINVQIHENGTGGGYAQFYPDDLAWADNQLDYLHNLTVSSFATVKLGADGGIKISNQSNDSVTVGVALEGWYTNLSTSVIVGNKSSTLPTQHSVVLQAQTPTGSSTTPVTYQYRVGTTGAFTPIPAGDMSATSDGTSLTAWPLAPSNGMYPQYDWDVWSTLNHSTASTLLQVEACYGTSSADPNWLCTMPNNLSYNPGSFSESAATEDVGPGTVALETGDYEIGSEDADVSTSLGVEAIGRTLTTLTPAAASTTGNGVFGPGWTTDLIGPGVGDGDLSAWDYRSQGFMKFTDSSGTAYLYAATSDINKYPISFAGIDDTAGDGTVVTLISATKVTMNDADGTVATWLRDSSSNPYWTVSDVVEPGSNTTSTYTLNSAGLVTRILAPVPAGVSCTSPDTTPGCRSLVLTYGTPAGTNATRLVWISASIPQASGVSHYITIRSYDYDSSGRLIDSYDPRNYLKTSYTYATSGTGSASATRLATLTEPGTNPWSFTYDDAGRLSTVSQTVPVTDPSTGAVSDQKATSTIVYGLPNSGITGLPDLSPTGTAAWGQNSDRPTSGYGTAIFPPDHVPSSTTVAGMGTGDWAYASLHYLDIDGREVDTANYSSTADPVNPWLIDTTNYYPDGHVYWTLSAANRARAIGDLPIADPLFAAATSTARQSYGDGLPDSAIRASLLESIYFYGLNEPSELTDAFGPNHPVALNDGSLIEAQAHTNIKYDQGAPNNDVNPATGDPYRLPTAVVSTFTKAATSSDLGWPYATTTTNGYAAVASMVTAGITGWDLGEPTTTTLRMSATGGGSGDNADLVTTHVYDSDGREIATWQPGDSTGTTPRTQEVTYYSASGSGTCGGNAAAVLAAGLVCQTSPGGQPASGSPLPTTSLVYDQWGNPVHTTQVYGAGVGAPSRDTYLGYDALERITSSDTQITNLDGAKNLPAVDTTYDTATGLPATLATDTSQSQTVASTYDEVGAVKTFTDGTGNTATYGYDIDGRLVRLTDARGTTTWTYDEGGEHRGLPTSEIVDATGELGGAFAGMNTFGATYDADGNLSTETYPNGLVASTTYDTAGNPTSLTYAKDGSTWYADTQVIGAARGADRVAHDTTTLAGNPYSDQGYTYDAAGRLVSVLDNVTAAGTGSPVGCTTRTYAFDNHSNRTSLTSNSPAADASCSTSTTATTTNYNYDAGDRLTSDTAGTYTYDALGRTTTVPVGDATGTGSHTAATGATGDATISYYSNDMVATQSQGSTQIAFDLSPLQTRIGVETTTTGGGSKPGTSVVTDHYDDGSDSPAWTDTTTTPSSGPGAGVATTTWSRDVTGPAGDLAAQISGQGASTATGSATMSLQITDLHGDVVSTIPCTTTVTAADLANNFTQTTEYGIPRSPEKTADNTGAYGWEGGAQRSGDDLAGLTLMGARLYNPAAGRFLSADSIYGGNANAYLYPDDPINGEDVTGLCWSGFGAVCSVVSHSLSFLKDHWKTGVKIGLITGFVAVQFIPGVGEVVDAAAGAEILEGEAADSAGLVEETLPGVKEGWVPRPARTGKGIVFQKEGAVGNRDSIRIMGKDADPRYPNGYVIFTNGENQPLTLKGKPGPPSLTHIPRNPDGSYPIPNGW